MILFDLKCARDHRFEGWFRDSETYDRQNEAGEIACPHCGDVTVVKAPMAPRLAKHRDAKHRDATHRDEVPQPEKLAEALAALREHVEQTCDYVGDRFTEEARRIYYKEAEPRPIYGEASDADARELREEGITVARIPWPPKAQ